ncbi:DMT family transporter [Loktanella agnita]|uniref:DMT family transporter n=1 Tax=Loktanella agnita TaxID=287097 RepID=UPI0039889560
MQLFLITALTMTAFAANSVLNRIAVADYGMDPMDFAALRVVAGAVMLWALVLPRRAPRPALWTAKRIAGAAALALYMFGFSWAYISLGAGPGALILFGVLQVIVFGWAVVERQPIPPLRWVGAAIALVGLFILLWPTGAARLPVGGTLAMTLAAIGWAAYTLLGRAEADALGATASNFLLCVPITGLAMLITGPGMMSLPGVITALIAGAITSGLGYALWYRVLPSLPTTIAGIAQLSVPVIAVVAGAALLAEPISTRMLLSGTLVLGGIGVSVLKRR